MKQATSQAEAYAHIPAPPPCCDHHAPLTARGALTMADQCLYAARQNVRLAQLCGSWSHNQAELEADLRRAEEMRRRAVACLEGRPHVGQPTLFEDVA